MITVKKALSYGKEILTGDLSALESRILLGYILNIDSQDLIINLNKAIISDIDFRKYDNVLKRRLKKEPIAYIINKKEFFGRDFYVNKDVLIPRNDSETLIEAIIKDYIDSNKDLNILELGVGSGCLIITLLLELSNAKGIGIDISKGAIEVSKKNSIYHNIEHRLCLYNKSWNKYKKSDKFDIIISNPPYIKENEYLDSGVKDYEPHVALFTKNDGLESYIEISKIVRNFAKKDASIYVELGQNMEKDVEVIFLNKGYVKRDFYKDLSGIIRCLKFGF